MAGSLWDQQNAVNVGSWPFGTIRLLSEERETGCRCCAIVVFREGAPAKRILIPIYRTEINAGGNCHAVSTATILPATAYGWMLVERRIGRTKEKLVDLLPAGHGMAA